MEHRAERSEREGIPAGATKVILCTPLDAGIFAFIPSAS
jgi:hypothetical protein